MGLFGRTLRILEGNPRKNKRGRIPLRQDDVPGGGCRGRRKPTPSGQGAASLSKAPTPARRRHKGHRSGNRAEGRSADVPAPRGNRRIRKRGLLWAAGRRMRIHRCGERGKAHRRRHPRLEAPRLRQGGREARRSHQRGSKGTVLTHHRQPGTTQPTPRANRKPEPAPRVGTRKGTGGTTGKGAGVPQGNLRPVRKGKPRPQTAPGTGTQNRPGRTSQG